MEGRGRARTVDKNTKKNRCKEGMSEDDGERSDGMGEEKGRKGRKRERGKCLLWHCHRLTHVKHASPTR